jgi:hypothetical protein
MGWKVQLNRPDSPCNDDLEYSEGFCYLQVSISPTFYEQLFCTKVFLQQAFAYNLGLYFFVKKIGAK